MKKWVMWLAIVAIAVGATTGCNTTEGVGEDIEEAGEKIRDAVD